MSESSDLHDLYREAKRAEEALADAQAEVRTCRERATQAWLRYHAAADKTQLTLDLEEA